MPNAYTTKLAGRAGKPVPIYHQAYYFFNTNNNKIPAFIITPDMYYMNSNLRTRTNTGFLKQRLVNMTGGAPHGEARARRMVNNALHYRRINHATHSANERSRMASFNRRLRAGLVRAGETYKPQYSIKGHQAQINFYNKLRRALGAGPMTNRSNPNLNNNNNRINQALQLLIKQRLKNFPKRLSETSRYNAIRRRQNLLDTYIKEYKKSSNVRVPLGRVLNSIIRTRNALRVNASSSRR